MIEYTPEQFFAEHRSWLEDGDAVQVGELPDGGFAVFLKVDGNYRLEADAKRSAASVRKMVRRALRKPKR